MSGFFSHPHCFCTGYGKNSKKWITDDTIFINSAPKTLVRMVGRVFL